MTQPAPAAQLDPQIVAILAGLNGGGAQASADDPPVYYGIAPNVSTRDGRKVYGAEVPRTKPLSEYNKQFYGLDKTALTQFQQRAYDAGLYGNSKPRFGDYDEDTYQIWQSVGVRAARFYAAGQNFTTNDVLDMAVQSSTTEDKQARAYATRTDVVNLQDPATIRDTLRQAWKQETGRAPKPQQLDTFVKVFRSAQANAQRTVNSAQDRAEAATRAAQDTVDAGGTPDPAPLSQEVDLTMPDLASRAQEYARAQDPSGAGAHDIAGKFGMFVKLLGGIV